MFKRLFATSAAVLLPPACGFAHTGPRIWIGSAGGEIVTFDSATGGGFTPDRVFIGGIDEATLRPNGRLDDYPFPGTEFYATDFPGYQVRTDGQAGFTTGKSFGFEFAGPLFVFDPATQLFASVRKQYGTPGPAPQMQVAAGSNAVKTGLAPTPGFSIVTYNAAGDHGHVVTALLGDGANAGDGPHAVYALPLRLTGTGLQRSKPYYVLLGRDRGYLEGESSRDEFLAAEQAALNTLANQNGWPGQWWADANGNYSDAAKWMPDVADVPTLPAQFLSRITAPRTITVDGNFSVGTVTFASAHGYTLSSNGGSNGGGNGGGRLTLHASDGVNAIRVLEGSHAIASPVTFTVDARIDVAAGAALTLSGDIAASDRAITKTGGGDVAMTSLHAAALDITAGNVTMLSGGGSVSRIGNLSIADGAALDLGDNSLIVPGGNIAELTAHITSAYNYSAWDGDGIKTSQPAARPEVGLTTLAIATADETFYAGGTFKGVDVASGDVLIMYTYAGDVNLDGVVDGADYGTLDNWIQFPGTSGYANGDVNYDGVIDGADYGVLDNSIQLQGDQFPVDAAAGASASVSAVPEPAALGSFVIAVAVGATTARRRRRSTVRNRPRAPERR